MSDVTAYLPYYGGKRLHLEFIYQFFPRNENLHVVDVFGGGGSVILNSPVRYRERTYNDMDSRLVNFFRVLRDQPEEFRAKMANTPYSREEFESSRIESEDPVEDARRYYVGISQAINRMSRSNVNWSYAIGIHGSKVGGITDVVDRRFAAVTKALLQIQIENKDALDLIKSHDSPDTFFYCDPPYLPSERIGMGYQHEMTEAEHDAMARVLLSVDGKVLLSGYENDKYNEWFAGWEKHHGEEKYIGSSKVGRGEEKKKRVETIWRNYRDEPMLGNEQSALEF